MRQRITSLHNNDRAILNAYAAQCLSDDVHSISQTVSLMAQQKQLSDILRKQQKIADVKKSPVL